MAEYHIYVRNYHWSYQNTVVQCPVLDLNALETALVVRPLEGPNKQEPRIIESVSDLRDDILEEEYRTEAHGVFVPVDPQQTDHFPIWMPVYSGGCKDDEAYVVNLKTFKTSSISVKRVCWVPSLEAPDNRLYTVIGAPRRTLRVMRVLALVQQLGSPSEAKLVLVDPKILAGYEKVSEFRKKGLFEIQLRAIRTNAGRPSNILLGIYRVFASPYGRDSGRLSLEEILDEDLEVSRSSYSDRHSRGSFNGSDDDDDNDDDDSLYTRPKYLSLVVVPNRPYTCDCRYAALRPTHFNPCPSHRHGTDDECSLGSAHTKHCVFADHAPKQCVISDSGETHECCTPLYQDIEFELEKISGRSCFADADALLQEAERERTNVSDFIDGELAISDWMHTNSQFQLPADTQSMYSVRSNSGAARWLDLEDSSVSTEVFQGLSWDLSMAIESYGSPEPQDMVF